MRSSRLVSRLRCARRLRRPSHTLTAPIAVPSPKRVTREGRDGRGADGRSLKRLPRGSRQAAKTAAVPRNTPSTSRKVNFHAAGEFRRRFNETGQMTTKEKFTAKDVQTLRQRTGAGMMESKKALEETGDMD